MKRFLFFAVALAAVASCGKEQQGSSAVSGETVTLRATVDIAGQLTKVAPDDPAQATVTFHWETGDKVTISNNSGSQVFTVSSISGQSAELVGTALPDMSSYTATYNTADSGIVSLVEGSFKPIASGSGSNSSFTLDTFSPVLKLGLKGTATIKTVKYYVGGVLKTTLDCGTSGLALSSTSKTVYFPVLNTATTNTAKLEFYEGDVKILEKPISSEVPGKIVIFPELQLYPYYENGNFYGLGVPITVGTEPSTTTAIWAPVNCGYEPATTAPEYKGYTYGKMYQWGRKYGQGYKDESFEDADYVGKVGGGQTHVEISEPLTSHPDGAVYNGNFYYNTPKAIARWYSGADSLKLWNTNEGTENPVSKSGYDPCPDGWRVPVISEYESLTANISPWVSKDGQSGCYCSGSTAYSESVPSIFLPAAGNLSPGGAQRGVLGVYYSSSVNYGDETHPILLITYGSEYGSGVFRNPMSSTGGSSVRCIKE